MADKRVTPNLPAIAPVKETDELSNFIKNFEKIAIKNICRQYEVVSPHLTSNPSGYANSMDFVSSKVFFTFLTFTLLTLQLLSSV